jgi:hypothetical protein
LALALKHISASVDETFAALFFPFDRYYFPRTIRNSVNWERQNIHDKCEDFNHTHKSVGDNKVEHGCCELL